MTVDESSLPPALPPDPDRLHEPRRRPGRLLAFLALLLALAALGGSGWLWWSGESTRSGEAARRAADAERLGRLEDGIAGRLQRLEDRLQALEAGDAGPQMAELEQDVRALEAEGRESVTFRAETAAWMRTLQTSVEGINARIAGLEARLAALDARGLDGRVELDLAELDYLLRLAQERLQLFADVRTADRALQLAEAHVAAFDNPIFAALQREIAAARRELAAADLPDPATLDRELDTVQQRLATLPFRGEPAGNGSTARSAGEAGWWTRLKAALSGLVTVRREVEQADRLPALADQELIRQRAWLEVERMRLAAMRGDAAAYAAANERIRDTVERWFAPDHRGTRAVMQALTSAAALDVDPELPDISGPWAALRALRANGAAPPDAPAPPAVPGSATGDPGSPGAARPDGEGGDGR